MTPIAVAQYDAGIKMEVSTEEREQVIGRTHPTKLLSLKQCFLRHQSDTRIIAGINITKRTLSLVQP
jgi:hypothetical protein